jgi:hypothetical protein
MSKHLWLVAAFAALVSVPPAGAGEPMRAPVVVVELFTSQGCSSCPPADVFLGELARRPGVLALGFHVDYWNYIGWNDPYSQPMAAERQRGYGQRLGLHYVYTPQMVIDGSGEGIGSQPDKIAPLLHAARQRPLTGPALSLEKRLGGFHLHVGNGSAPSAATIWLVGIDRQHDTKVLHGENEGSTAHDYQVVRSFKSVGSWHGAALDLDLSATSATGDQAAVLLQLDGTGPILGAATATGPSS